MSKLFAIPELARLPKLQVLLCLLLVGLVLYNPYLAGPESSASTCFRHAASNRATVGASELQHFTPVDNRGVLLAAFVLLFPGFPIVAPRSSRSGDYRIAAVCHSPQFLPASLWFRPPPTV
jgi:hypothetical protein